MKKGRIVTEETRQRMRDAQRNFRRLSQIDSPKLQEIIKQTHDEVDQRRQELGVPKWCWKHKQIAILCCQKVMVANAD